MVCGWLMVDTRLVCRVLYSRDGGRSCVDSEDIISSKWRTYPTLLSCQASTTQLVGTVVYKCMKKNAVLCTVQ